MNGIYDIIEKNLEKMTGNNAKDMPSLILRESIGGNAGRWKEFQCAGANFFYDPLNGEIQFFSNFSRKEDSDLIYDPRTHELRKSNGELATLENTQGMYWEGTFKVAMKLAGAHDESDTKYRVVMVILPKNTPKVAEANLEETVKEYNEKYGFEETDI